MQGAIAVPFDVDGCSCISGGGCHVNLKLMLDSRDSRFQMLRAQRTPTAKQK